jgi:ribonuclease VapC
MIVVDTSAIVAVLLGEEGSDGIERHLRHERCAMSAATRVELGIVVEARNGPAGAQLLEELLSRLDVEIVPLDAETAEEAIVSWRRYGKGRHPAGLNLGDTFAYALARRSGLPLLFVGDDFARTDVEPVPG